MSSKWDLLIFSVAPRAHLLHDAWRSFGKYCDVTFSRVILSIAGYDNNYFGVIEEIAPDVLLWDREAPGYYFSAKRAIRETNADYIFWMEDDYTFHRYLPFQEVERMFSEHENLCQVTMPRGNRPKYGKSVSKLRWMYATVSHFANGNYIRTALASVLPGEICRNGESLGIEEFLGTSMKMIWPDVNVATLSNADGRYLRHIGSFYASPRDAVAVAPDALGSGSGITAKNNERSVENDPDSTVTLKSSVMLHGRNVIAFLILAIRALLQYPVSREMREFVFRSVQYFRHTP